MLILSFGYIIVWARFGSHLDWSRIPHNDAMKWFSSIGGIMIMVLQSANVWFAQLERVVCTAWLVLHRPALASDHWVRAVRCHPVSSTSRVSRPPNKALQLTGHSLLQSSLVALGSGRW
jgi:hypothetical protein